MLFEGLSEKLQKTFSKLRSHGKLTEKDIDLAMREVKLALLEADVNFKVVKQFIAQVKERAMGQEVMESITPGQLVVKIVHDELTALMGGETARLDLSKKPPVVILLCGLQGAGKTTTCGKLANYLRKELRRNPLLVAADVYRPAAMKQLQVLGDNLNVPVVVKEGEKDVIAIADEALKLAYQKNYDTIIFDTAGRLHIDEELMDELKRLKARIEPSEILLVVDSMTGQDAVNVAKSFNEALDITGVVLTKLDGDTRGGAALSVRSVADCPIKFACQGEKMNDIEPFHPDRLASRILGMGDIVTLVEQAQKNFDMENAKKLEEKLRKNTFSLQDFLDQMQQVKSMGSMDDILSMLPGANKLKGVQVDEKEMARTEAIIKSMTPYEREHPDIINFSRRKRIAAGSGTSIQQVNRLLKQFAETQKMMKQLTGKKFGKRMKLPFM